MNMDKETYKKYADAHAPRSPIGKDCLNAFIIGGLICTLGEGLKNIYSLKQVKCSLPDPFLSDLFH